MKAVFITATDTEAGKTVVCGLLGRFLLEKGYNVITQKWIQTGSPGFTPDIMTHLKLMKKKKKDIEKYLPYMAPYTFKLPASAHLAARSENKIVNAAKIKNCLRTLTKQFDYVIAEGIGGALVPFNKKKCVIDIAKDLDLPVIIVAKNKLGAINHTLLTIEALESRKMKILGIIFNGSPGKEKKIILEDNPKIIRTLTGEKLLGNLPWSTNQNQLYKAFEPIGNKILKEMTGKITK